MARKPKEQLDAEYTAGNAPAFVAEDDSPNIQVSTVPLVPEAPVKRPMPPPPPKRPALTVTELASVEPKRYRVTKGGRALCGNSISTIKVDKVIDEREFNVESLRGQGIELESIA
jgi:hypothetical protein